MRVVTSQPLLIAFLVLSACSSNLAITKRDGTILKGKIVGAGHDRLRGLSAFAVIVSLAGAVSSVALIGKVCWCEDQVLVLARM